MTSVRAAGCPVLTANRNKFELAAERERMEEGLGYVLVGMGRSPFPCPVPRQSPASANELHRRNEWLAAYVPSQGMQSDDVGDAGDALPKDLVRHGEGVLSQCACRVVSGECAVGAAGGGVPAEARPPVQSREACRWRR